MELRAETICCVGLAAARSRFSKLLVEEKNEEPNTRIRKAFTLPSAFGFALSGVQAFSCCHEALSLARNCYVTTVFLYR